MLSWISRMSIPSTGRKSIGITFAPYWSRSFAGMFRLTSRSYRLYERPIRMTAWAPAFSTSEIANAPRSRRKSPNRCCSFHPSRIASRISRRGTPRGPKHTKRSPDGGGAVALDRVARLGDGLLESLSRNRLVGSRAHLQVEPQTGKEGLPEREPLVEVHGTGIPDGPPAAPGAPPPGSTPRKRVLSAVARTLSRARRAIPIAPMTPLCGGTMIGFPRTWVKAAATASLYAVPPWEWIVSPILRPRATRVREL